MMIIRKTTQHELEAVVNGTSYKPVRFVSVAPLSCGLDKSISVLDNEGQEIGWIDDLGALEEESALLLAHYLEQQRPYQEISHILNVNSQHFPTNWTVILKNNDRPLTITIEYAEELQRLPQGDLLITDKHKKVYIIKQPQHLDIKSKKKIKAFFVVY